MAEVQITHDNGRLRVGEVISVPDARARMLVKRGLAAYTPEASLEVNVPEMEPPRHICGCGFVGKSMAELKAHQGACKVRLNLGCGPDIRKDFTNCDIRDLPGVDVVVDVADLHGFKAVDYIMALDVLEHMPQAVAESALAKWVSILKPGGTIEVQCPDVTHAAKIAYSDEWLIQLLYGGQDYPSNFHQSGFTLATIKKLLEGMGLEVVFEDQTKAGNLHVKAVKCG